MHTTPDPQSNGVAPEARPPGQLSTGLRSAGRVLARLFGLAVIAAAGVAGWFGVEQYVFPDVPGTVAASVNDGPWPDEFAEPTTRWDSFTISYTMDGAETHRSSFDPATQRTHITYAGVDGAALREVELAGLEAFERSSESPEWAPVDEARTDAHIFLGVGGTKPVHLSELAPEAADEFISVSELDTTDDTRRFLVVVDAGAFRLADPVSFHRWSNHELYGTDPSAEQRWTVDVRADGFITRWEGRSPSVETWSDYPTGLTFESPLAVTGEPPAPAAEADAPVPSDDAAPSTDVEE